MDSFWGNAAGEGKSPGAVLRATRLKTEKPPLLAPVPGAGVDDVNFPLLGAQVENLPAAKVLAVGGIVGDDQEGPPRPVAV